MAHALRGEGFDASEDGTGRGTPIVPVAGALCRDTFTGGAGGRPEGAAAGHFVPVAFQNRFRGDDGRGYDRAPPISVGVTGALETVKPWHIAFDCKGTQVQTVSDGSHPTLRSMGHANSHQNAGGHAAVAFDLRGREGGAMPEGPHDTANIRAASDGSSRSYVAQPWAVRRLTPRECERLQGFPDDYTQIPNGNKPTADGPRYKQIGNSWPVNCIDWLGERMDEVDAWENTTTQEPDHG